MLQIYTHRTHNRQYGALVTNVGPEEYLLIMKMYPENLSWPPIYESAHFDLQLLPVMACPK